MTVQPTEPKCQPAALAANGETRPEDMVFTFCPLSAFTRVFVSDSAAQPSDADRRPHIVLLGDSEVELEKTFENRVDIRVSGKATLISTPRSIMVANAAVKYYGELITCSRTDEGCGSCMTCNAPASSRSIHKAKGGVVSIVDLQDIRTANEGDQREQSSDKGVARTALDIQVIEVVGKDVRLTKVPGDVQIIMDSFTVTASQPFVKSCELTGLLPHEFLLIDVIPKDQPSLLDGRFPATLFTPGGDVSLVNKTVDGINLKICGNTTLVSTPSSIMIALKSMHLGDAVLACDSFWCGKCFACTAKSTSNHSVQGGWIKYIELNADVKILRVSGQAVELIKVMGDVLYVPPNGKTPKSLSVSCHELACAEAAPEAVKEQVTETLSPARTGGDGRCAPEQREADAPKRVDISKTDPPPGKEDGVAETLNASIKREQAVLEALISPQKGERIDKARVLSASKTLLGLLETLVNENDKPNHVIIDIPQDASDGEQHSDPAKENGAQHPDPSAEEDSHPDPAQEAEPQDSGEAQDHAIQNSDSAPEQQAEAVEGCPGVEEAMAELRPFIKYAWEGRRLAEQWIFSLDDVARLSDADWNVLTLSPGTTLALYKAAQSRVTLSAVSTPAKQETIPSGRRLCTRVVSPKLFDRLTICVNIDFVPTKIFLGGGFRQDFVYALNFKDTTLCLSREGVFDLSKDEIRPNGLPLMESAGWDLRKLEAGHLWISSPGFPYCSVVGDSGRFFFHEYSLRFSNRNKGANRTFKMNRMCRFDLGDLDTVALDFTHAVSPIHWDSPVGLGQKYCHAAKTLFMSDLAVKNDDGVVSIAAPCPGQLWVETQDVLDVLPFGLSCTQTYLE